MTYGDTNNKVAYTYDTLGRTSKKTLTVGGKAYATIYSYVAGSNGIGNTTGLISQITKQVKPAPTLTTMWVTSRLLPETV